MSGDSKPLPLAEQITEFCDANVGREMAMFEFAAFILDAVAQDHTLSLGARIHLSDLADELRMATASATGAN